MPEIDLTGFDKDSFVLHFGRKGHSIDALILAKSLTEISKMTDIICHKAYPDIKFTIVVDSVGSGSFRLKLGVLAAATLFLSSDVIKNVAAEVLSAYVLKITSTTQREKIVYEDDKNITIDYGYEKIVDENNNTTTERAERRVTMPVDSYGTLKAVESDPQMKKHMDSFVKSVQRDSSMETFGFGTRIEDVDPVVNVPRSDFPTILKHSVEKIDDAIDEDAKVIERNVEAVVRVAVFDLSSPKWEFWLDGKKISAFIVDNSFLDKLNRGDISVGKKDTFKAKIMIYRKRAKTGGIWVDDRIEITELRHIPFNDWEQMSWIDDAEGR